MIAIRQRCWPVVRAIVLATGLMIPLLMLQGSYRMPVLVVVYLYGAVLVGTDLVVGFTGQLTLAMPAFLAIGAYGSGALTTREGAPVFAAIGIGLLVSVALALLIGSMAVRISGFGLVIVSLFMTTIVGSLFRGVSYFGGNFGISGIPPLRVFGLDSSRQTDAAVMALALFVGCFTVADVFIRSGPGRELIASGTDFVAAASVGIAVARRRTQAFVASAVMATLAGSFFAHSRAFISPQQFDPILAIEFVLMLYLGGVGRLWPGVLGAGIIEFLPELGSSFNDYKLIVEGVLFVALLTFFRGGIYRIIGMPLSQIRKHFRHGPLPRSPAESGGAVEGPGPMLAGRSQTRVFPNPDPSSAGTAVLRHDTFIKVSGLTKSFGGVRVLNDVSFEHSSTGVLGLVGPNGAGKSTLFNVLGGELKPDHGRVTIGLGEVTGLSATLIARQGVGRTFQTVRLWDSLTIVDNVALGLGASNRHGFIRALTKDSIRQARGEAKELLRQLGMDVTIDQRLDGTPLGERRLIEFARAILRGPRLILLDEPASGLDLAQREALGTMISQVARTRSVILVEHDIEFVRNVADRLIVLDLGEVLFDGAPEDGLRDPRVVTAYLGQKLDGPSAEESSDVE